jgi:hypothetical protein
VPHDAGEQRRIDARAVDRVRRRIVGRRLDRRPLRRPQRIDPRRLVRDLRDVPAFLENRDAQYFVLDRRGAAAAV